VGIGYNVTRISFPHYIVLLKLEREFFPLLDRLSGFHTTKYFSNKNSVSTVHFTNGWFPHY